jgi:hypothetical protein
MSVDEYKNVVKAHNILTNQAKKEDYNTNIGVTSPEKPTFGSLTKHLDEVGFDTTKPAVPSEPAVAVPVPAKTVRPKMRNSLNNLMSGKRTKKQQPKRDPVILYANTVSEKLRNIISMLNKKLADNSISASTMDKIEHDRDKLANYVVELETNVRKYEAASNASQSIQHDSFMERVGVIDSETDQYRNKVYGGKRCRVLSSTVKRSTKRAKKAKRVTQKRR